MVATVLIAASLGKNPRFLPLHSNTHTAISMQARSSDTGTIRYVTFETWQPLGNTAQSGPWQALVFATRREKGGRHCT